MNGYNNYVTIDMDAILENYRAVKKKTGVSVMAVVKADAYGHGAVQIARLLEPECPFFGVSSVSEALELRKAGIATPILILGHTPPSSFPILVKENIRPTIFTLDDARMLSQEACQQNTIARCHIAVDTGMSRIGFQASPEDAAICKEIAALPNLEIEGLFSHFATADCADLRRSEAQARLFDRFNQMLRELGVQIPILHLDNSAGIMNFENHYNMVRCGIVTYGLYPSAEVAPENLPITPALSWYSRISHIKTLPAGREISYGGTYVTTRPTRVATVPVGYADGYRRALSNRFFVLIGGKKAPVLGRVCMDQIMVDVTDIPQAEVNDKVILIGKDGDEAITVEEIAAAADSFNYEFVCGISRRVCRQYLRNKSVVQEVDFLLD